MKLKVLELFSGSAELSNTFREYGHEALTLDFNSQYNPDICCDILDFEPLSLGDFKPDIIHASPECRCFSVAAMGHHWGGGKKAYIPKTEDAKTAIKVVHQTLEIIYDLNPKIFIIENPVGVMRKLDRIVDLSRNYFHHVVTYCQYGDTRMKPTDIWTNNSHWHPKPRCHNNNKCHVAAPRGSKTGTQGLKNAYERAKIPKALCVEIVKSCENALLGV